MKKHYEISLGYKKVIVEIDHAIFDIDFAWSALERFEPEIEKYEGTLDTILRWIGWNVMKKQMDNIDIKHIGYYICLILELDPGTIVVVRCDNIYPDMLEFNVREVIYE